MTQHELEVFPIIYVPILAKIQRDLNKQEKRKGFGSKSKTQNYASKVQTEVLDSNESTSEREFNEEPGGGNYVVPVSEPHTAYNLHNPRAREDHSFQSVFSHLPKPPEPQRTSKVPTAHLSNFQDKNPVKPPVPQRIVSHLTEGSVAVASGSLARRRPLPIVPQQHSSNRANQNPHVPVPTQHVQLKQSIRTSQQNLDPTWYRGRITRNQAELSLREVNKVSGCIIFPVE
ncbi:uncharacterized protein lcp2b [Girardinichthys multiradiatus]|uniref:uncharacterized protein lcp2b n=1 Tax=Girardinichthys multiradiatus TaxID=208333 RepID=UPI001FABAB93|nr:uncharacterized protein lcp2b [Girardinichthys multiradiatus]